MSNEPAAREDCEQHDCFIPVDRRRFLRDSFLSVAGALIAVGMRKADAFAMPMAFTEARSSTDSIHTYPLPLADGAQIDKTNGVILVRWEGAVYAFDLSCPHQNTALKWDEHDHSFTCRKHHSQFKPNGEYIAESGRATRNMDRFAIVKDGASIRVDVDKLYREDEHSEQWIAALVKA